MNDVIRLQLPLRPEQLPVLRATLGAIAGNLAFNYDEITQLRVAVSEVFDLALRHSRREDQSPDQAELDVRFVVHSDRLEIRVAEPTNYSGELMNEQDEESRAVLTSLMDQVNFGDKNDLVAMVKYRPEARSE